MKNNNFKIVLGIILICAALILLAVTAVSSVVLHFMNPDMTDLRFFIEYPSLTFAGIASIIGLVVGRFLVE